MRRLSAFSTIALLCAAPAAHAADMPTVRRAPVTVAAPLMWNGFYIGGNLGYGWANISDPNNPGSTDMSGVIGGGQIGYNWQSGALVLGIEADGQFSGIQNSSTLGIVTVKASAPWFATFRGRVGYAAGPWLFYLTGGGAYSNFQLEGTALGVTISDSDSKFSFTGGAGFEWKFAPNWGVGAEYLYVDTGNTTATLFGTTLNARAQTHIGRGKVNYHF